MYPVSFKKLDESLNRGQYHHETFGTLLSCRLTFVGHTGKAVSAPLSLQPLSVGQIVQLRELFGCLPLDTLR